MGGLTKFDHIPFDSFFNNSIIQWIKNTKNKLWSNVIYYAFTKGVSTDSVKEILATYYAAQQYSRNVSEHVSREFQTTLMAVAKEVENPLLCKTIYNSYLLILTSVGLLFQIVL